MKKIFVAVLALTTIAQSVNAASFRPVEPTPATSGITLEQFQKMTPKELEQLSGKKLNTVQKLKFKAAQKLTKRKAFAAEGKSQLTALLLALFLGGLGIHRFYLGYTWQGVVQLLTLGGLGVWALIDLIRIITGDLKPKDGEYAQKLGD